MDGHSSYVTINVVQKACAMGLHFLMLTLHFSYTMQPLNVVVFKSFKEAFLVYRMYGHFKIRAGARNEFFVL